MPRLIFCVRALIQLTYAKVDIIVFEAHQARITEAQHVNLNKISIFYQKEKILVSFRCLERQHEDKGSQLSCKHNKVIIIAVHFL